MSVTKPVSPKFTKTKTKDLTRNYVNEGDANKDLEPVDKFKAALMKSMNTKKSSAPVKQPASTRSVALAQ